MAILLTHAQSYVGPGTVEVLHATGAKLVVHDPAFSDPNKAAEFLNRYPNCIVLTAQTPAEIVAELESKKISVTSVIHNNVLGNTPKPIENIQPDEFQTSFDALYLFPVQLTQFLLPIFKANKLGSMVFVTSARYLKPEPGYALATSIRSGTTSFALALAAEVAGDNISVNVVAPNFLYSEAYYPKAKYIDDPVGQEYIRAQVPLGRLGEPSEIGELIAFLVSGKSNFVTGQVINFTGGWPN